MTHTGIECFLAICRHKTGSAAAQALYITQPSLSARLKVLEREVGTPLFHRHKGSREMVLTPTGSAFYELALQYEAVVAKMQELCSAQPEQLRISTFNSLGTYLLPAVYERFLQEHPGILLDIQDMELDAASRSLHNGETDLAFTAGHSDDPLLTQTPVFSEPMVLICGSNTKLTAPVDLTQLSGRNEVYIEWSSHFARWHQRTLGSQKVHLRISMMAQLQQFLEREHCWAIVPSSVAEGISAKSGIHCIPTAFTLPHRQISCLTVANRDNPAVKAFLDCLKQTLATRTDIELHLQ